MTATAVRPSGMTDASVRRTSRLPGFDVLRIVAAAGVLVSHSLYLLNRAQPALHYSDAYVNLGRLCVAVFFALSGHLITGAYLRTSGGSVFALRRAARIWPALLVSLTATAVVVGPLVSSSHPFGYFTSRGTWAWLAGNALLVPVQGLPGVFTANPHTVANGVLWSLSLEVFAYCVIALLVTVGRRLPRMPPALLVSLAALATSLLGWPWLVGSVLQRHGPLLTEVSGRLQLVAIFLIAAALKLRGTKVPGWVVLPAVLTPVLLQHSNFSILLTPAVALGSLAFATNMRRGSGLLHRLGDPSYGMYVYGFVVQQVLVAATHASIGLPAMMATSLAVSLLLGVLSWRVIESPMLRRAAPFELPARVGPGGWRHVPHRRPASLRWLTVGLAIGCTLGFVASVALRSLPDRRPGRIVLSFDGPEGSAPSALQWGAKQGVADSAKQIYTPRPQNVSLDGNGRLRIVARRDSYSFNGVTREFTSARISTFGKVAVQPGSYVEAEVALPTGRGVWPAFWMEGTSLHDVGWPHAGEIDIAELVGVWPTKVLRNVHVGRPAGAGAVQWGWQQPRASTVFDPAPPHLYGVYFDANEVRFYLDRSLVQTIGRTDVAGVGGTWPFGEPQFLILNVAVGSLGGEPDAGTWPQTMTVGAVSIYPRGSRTPRLL